MQSAFSGQGLGANFMIIFVFMILYVCENYYVYDFIQVQAYCDISD